MNPLSLLLSPLCLSLTLVAVPAQAQNVFNKLADKLQNKVGGAAPAAAAAMGGAAALPADGGVNEAQAGSANDARMAEQDRADTSLDQRPFKPDQRGVGGIYLANFLMGGLSLNTERAFVIAKVLMEYDDATGVLTMRSRHGFEANDSSKLVPKAQWINDSMKKDKARQAQRAANTLWLRNGASENRVHYKYGQQSYRKDLQGNEVPDKLLPEGLGGVLELEPGILYVGPEPYAATQGKPYGHNLLRPGMQVPLFYKPGKEEAAKAWTVERVVAQFQKAGEAIEQAGEAANAVPDENYELKPPHAQALTSAEVAAAKAQWQQLITGRDLATVHKSRKFSISYVYASSPWQDMTKKQMIKGSYVDTIISRSRVVVAVFQDQDGKYWTNRFYLVEKAPVGVYFGERWSGQYEYALPESAIPVAIGKSAALKYQR